MFGVGLGDTQNFFHDKYRNIAILVYYGDTCFAKIK